MLTRAVELLRALSAQRIPRRRIQFGQRLERLLAAHDLAANYRNRLTRLAGVAEADLQRLVD